MIEKTGLYVHFPFCRSKCPYCHFASVAFREDLFRLWKEGIEREIAASRAEAGTANTLYIGGGTPSLLRPRDLRDLVGALGRRFGPAFDEFTLEANPGRAAETDLRGWRDAGVDRLSVGIQSFDDGLLRLLGRGYTSAEAQSFLRKAREAGFANIGLDLMIGVPTETMEKLEDTLKEALDFGPEHVSVYILENIEGLPFEDFVRDHPLDDDQAAEAYDRTRESLEAAGLERYEISNFALSGRECRHNLKYWRYEPFLGFGPSAASHVAAARWTNRAGIGEWASALAAGIDPREEIRILTPKESLREALVFGLRLARGVDIGELGRRFGLEARDVFREEIADLVAEGLVVLEGNRLRIAPEHFLISNRVYSRFV